MKQLRLRACVFGLTKVALGMKLCETSKILGDRHRDSLFSQGSKQRTPAPGGAVVAKVPHWPYRPGSSRRLLGELVERPGRGSASDRAKVIRELASVSDDPVIRDPFDMLLWVYPHVALDKGIDYRVEIEADHRGVRIMVARDGQSIPHAIAVAVGHRRSWPSSPDGFRMVPSRPRDDAIE